MHKLYTHQDEIIQASTPHYIKTWQRWRGTRVRSTAPHNITEPIGSEHCHVLTVERGLSDQWGGEYLLSLAPIVRWLCDRWNYVIKHAHSPEGRGVYARSGGKHWYSIVLRYNIYTVAASIDILSNYRFYYAGYFCHDFRVGREVTNHLRRTH